MPESEPRQILNTLLKIGLFVLLEIVGLWVFGIVLLPITGYFGAAALSVLLAAVVANFLVMRIYERTHLARIGLMWNAGAARNVLVGLVGGAAAAYVVVGGPLLVGAAELQAVPGATTNWRTLLFVSALLLFGAFGEEMFFRGYGFQVLMGVMGPWGTILPVSVLFGLAHQGNQNVTTMGLVNTVGWGVVLGYAFLRSGDLWLPIGLHFAWNWTLPMFGVNLSGFTIRVTGYAVHWKTSALWSGGDYGPEASLLTTLVLVVLLVSLHKAPLLRQRPFLLGARWED
jgi:membrane protease YdiL (CAAX protease family)